MSCSRFLASILLAQLRAMFNETNDVLFQNPSKRATSPSSPKELSLTLSPWMLGISAPIEPSICAPALPLNKRTSMSTFETWVNQVN
jgi:hypothetical protein